MPRFSVTLSCSFPNKKALEQAIMEINDFHEAGVKIESVQCLEKVVKVNIKKRKPNGFVFLIENGNVLITSKKFWEEHHFIDDSERNFPPLPDGFHELAEACFGYDGDSDPAELLTDYGFEETE